MSWFASPRTPSVPKSRATAPVHLSTRPRARRRGRTGADGRTYYAARAAPGIPGPPSRRSRSASALAVLGSLAGLLQAGLLALRDPRVAGEEAGLLDGRPVPLLV